MYIYSENNAFAFSDWHSENEQKNVEADDERNKSIKDLIHQKWNS